MVTTVKEKKLEVIFVGSFFNKGNNINIGGQMYASKSLIESELSNSVEWHLIDSTAISNEFVPLWLRLLNACKRLGKLIYLLLKKKISAALIFTGDGASFIEKGTMSLICKLFKVKVLLAPRSGLLIDNIMDKGFLFHFISFVFAKTDIIICQGEGWKTLFVKECGIYPSQCKIIPNWINTSEYPARLDGNKVIQITFLGWVDENKGIYELLESVRIISENYAFVLNIAGQGRDFSKIQELISKYRLDEIVYMKGWVLGKDKIELLRKTEILVLPSYFEGLPNAILEGMAMGIACIATEVGSIPEVITNRETGLLVKPKSVESLTVALKELIEDADLRSRLGDAGRFFIIKNHSIENAVDSFKEILFKKS